MLALLPLVLLVLAPVPVAAREVAARLVPLGRIAIRPRPPQAAGAVPLQWWWEVEEWTPLRLHVLRRHWS